MEPVIRPMEVNMATMQKVRPSTRAEAEPIETPVEPAAAHWVAWPVAWSAVWVGALASLTAVLVFGLIGVALGAHLVGPEHRVVDLSKIGFGAIACGVGSAFFAAVIGGWIAGKIAGIRRSEPA